MSSPVISVTRLKRSFKSGSEDIAVLKDISLTVNQGEFVAVMGASGSGKSTLLNLIGGLDTPTSGKVLIDGKDVFAMKDRKLTIFRRRNIGFIFQAFNLIPELTVEQNILFPVLLDYQKPDRAYLEELLTVLNLKDRRKHLPSQLSGGQQQRVAIARAIASEPKVSGGEPYLSRTSNDVLQKALDIAKKQGDQYVTLEAILLAIFSIKSQASQILKDAGLTEHELAAAIEELRKGKKANDQSAEDTYNALSKYAVNLNERARSGKLDPVIGRDDEIRRAADS